MTQYDEDFNINNTKINQQNSNFKLNKCPSCGVLWENHLGIQSTCTALKTAMKTLRSIAETPRNRGAKRYASSTVHFLESLIKGV